MRSNLRYKPIYKYFQKLRENIKGNEKLLNFKKKKMGKFSQKVNFS